MANFSDFIGFLSFFHFLGASIYNNSSKNGSFQAFWHEALKRILNCDFIYILSHILAPQA